VVPHNSLQDTLRLARSKVMKENHSREELMRGAYLSEVFAKYGVL